MVCSTVTVRTIPILCIYVCHFDGCNVILCTYVYAQSGEYPVRWNTKITSLGQKLMYLHAGMNGITQLQETGM